ncbi:MAG TPA: FtsX-like permease family protein, partial [Anaerolineales bacterium]|nr:FtsX-like permease family protein [Anaerolineales bacterium]
LSIAVGVFSIGVIAGAYVIISHDMSASYAANHPANIELRMADFNEDVLTSVRNMPGIAHAEGRRVFSIRVHPENGSSWTVIDLVAFNNFADNTVDLLTPIEGNPDPSKRQVALEKDALSQLGVKVGDQLIFEMPDGTTRTMPVVGAVQDPTTGAGDFLAPPFGYISMNTLENLQQPDLYNRIYATVSQRQDDAASISRTAGAVKDRLVRAGIPVDRVLTSKTHEHPLAATVNAILGILMALGVLIVFLSSSLIANTLNALLNQHLRYIGVMKLVGGRNRQILIMYLALIVSFGVLALLIAVPLGGQGAYGLAAFIAGELRFNLLGYRIVPLALAIQIAIGILVPLAAGLVPVVNGSKVTVLKAISGDLARGAGKPLRRGPKRESNLEKFQTRATLALSRRGLHIPRPLLISLRNTFRRRGRLLLTLFTLTMGGAIFIAVFNVRVTLHDYIGAIGNYFKADVELDFIQPYRVHEIQQYALQIPGVQSVEGWQGLSADLLHPDGSTLDALNIIAPPATSPLVQPIMVSGRWIEPGDERRLAISESALSDLPTLRAGDFLPLKVNGRTEQWQVVGIFQFVGQEGILAYAPLEYISQVNDLAGQSTLFRIQTVQHGRAYQDQMAETLDHDFRAQGFNVLQSQAGLASLDTASQSLDTLVTFLLIMALLTATVGSMGLAGTMGMNVLERTREIGIMRAIGAVDSIIMRTVIAEGMVIGSISFALAIILSVPFTYLLSYIVSLAVFETPIKTVFTISGYLIWLALILAMSGIASILPARNAARLTIREVLAYE